MGGDRLAEAMGWLCCRLSLHASQATLFSSSTSTRFQPEESVGLCEFCCSKPDNCGREKVFVFLKVYFSHLAMMINDDDKTRLMPWLSWRGHSPAETPSFKLDTSVDMQKGPCWCFDYNELPGTLGVSSCITTDIWVHLCA